MQLFSVLQSFGLENERKFEPLNIHEGNNTLIHFFLMLKKRQFKLYQISSLHKLYKLNGHTEVR